MYLAALDLSNLHNFAGGDGVFVIGICAAGFIIKFWRDGSIGKIVIILGCRASFESAGKAAGRGGGSMPPVAS